MLKKLMMSTALSAVMVTAAFAQSPSPPSASNPPPAAQSQGSGKVNFVTAQKPDQWLATKFKGTDVLGSDNQKIGDVSDILFDKSGKLVYHGAIDDSPGDAGQVKRHHLKEAINEMMQDREVTVKETRSVGCSINRG